MILKPPNGERNLGKCEDRQKDSLVKPCACAECQPRDERQQRDGAATRDRQLCAVLSDEPGRDHDASHDRGIPPHLADYFVELTLGRLPAHSRSLVGAG